MKDRRLKKAAIASGLSLLAAVAAAAAVGIMSVYGAPSAGKSGSFNGSPAHVDGENLYIDEINFPDPAFLALARSADKNNDGFLTVAEAEEVTAIDFDGSDASGVEFFTSLSSLRCSGGKLSSLDVSKNTSLRVLDCSSPYYSRGALSSLDLSKNTSLSELYCSYNSIEKLTLPKGGTLTWLDCSYNSLSSLDVSGQTGLSHLECSDNALTSLDVTGAVALTDLYCDRNRLLTIDLSENKNLYSASLSGQTSPINVPVTKNGSTYTVNLAAVLEKIDPAAVTYVTGEYADEILTGKFDAAKKTAEFSGDVLFVTFAHDVPLPDGSAQSMSVTAAADAVDYDEISITEKEIPDGNFRKYILQLLEADGDRVSRHKIDATTSLDLSGLEIKNLTGISLFTELTDLDVSGNLLTSLDVTGNKKLSRLDCSNNSLTSLYVPVMRGINASLDCSYNKLTTLVLRNEVRRVNCSHNSLVSVYIGSEYVSEDIYGGYVFDCSYNALTSLDASVVRDEETYAHKSYEYSVGHQVSGDGLTLVHIKGPGTYTASLAELLGADDLDRVVSVYSASDPENEADFDPVTGDAVFASDPGDKFVYKLRYFYKNGEPFGPDMDVTVPISLQEGILGDVDGSGTVNTLDALAILRYVFDSERYPIENISVADVDGNGTVNTLDALAILRYVFDSDRYPLGG